MSETPPARRHGFPLSIGRPRRPRGDGSTAGPADEAEVARERDINRLLALSDGVFAIAATLLVLDIRLPSSTHSLQRQLLSSWPLFLTYFVTFLLLAQIWANHHAMLDHIRTADWGMLLCNTLLLMSISFLPFPASVIAPAIEHGGERVAVVLYGICFALASCCFSLNWFHACRAELFTGSMTPALRRRYNRRFYPASVGYGIGTGLGALYPPAGLAVFASLVVLYWLPGDPGSSPAKR